jgi:transposase-like protein
MELALLPLIDDAKCFAMVRKLRWPEGVCCPHCESARVTRRGLNETQPDRQRYVCGDCGRNFDDLTDTIFAGHHQPLRVWLLCLYFMGLNLSNRQIAHELGLDEDNAHEMATQLRQGIVARQPEVVLSGEVECDEVYVVAGHKGHPEAVKKKGDSAAGGV